MKYANREMKIDQIIGYFNEGKINLIPPFQRGSVWKLRMRQGLIANMVRMRPIPAIFLYKEAAGSKFSYNILDGKQRLESLILFVGDKRNDLCVRNVREYFFDRPPVQPFNFSINDDGKVKAFKDLDEATVRSFREYAVPTIEIELDDDSSIDEIINLFIDINQTGVKVGRFDVVKAMWKDPLFKQVFDLVAVKQERKHALYYRAKSTPFYSVLKRLTVIRRSPARNAQVDRMWERLTEIALFARTGKHRAPVDILKSFIVQGQSNRTELRLSQDELEKLRDAFAFLQEAYKDPDLGESKLATDQPRFYTMITTLLGTDVFSRFSKPELKAKLSAFAKIIDGKMKPPAPLVDTIKEYEAVSVRQTTHPGSREKRQQMLLRALESV
jgi:hypothetical protein